MCIYAHGFCLDDNCVTGRVSYIVCDEWGALDSPSWCEWIVPGTIEE